MSAEVPRAPAMSRVGLPDTHPAEGSRTHGRIPALRSAALRLLALPAIASGAPHALAAQEDSVAVAPGVVLGLLSHSRSPAVLAIRPFRGPAEDAATAGAIVLRDLELSDRFLVVPAPALLADGPMEAGSGDSLGVDFVVDGELQPKDDGADLRVVVHDMLYDRVLAEEVFRLPAPETGGFRTAVHRVSDELVRWVSGEPGMAAAPVAFVQVGRDGGADLVLVDSDGEGRRRVASHDGLASSPSFSPDGRRIVYTAMAPNGTWDVLELDLADGSTRTVTPKPGLNLVPSYSSDGSRLVVTHSEGSREDLYAVAPEGGGLRLLRAGAMAGSYSPDGRWIAYSSDRLGSNQVWIMPAEGGEARLVSPRG
ncbi:MAG TPA: hypothetical protein VE173_00580, partial [Longimicrobiales bacterium]|nr:hypothetical protein [Longimicrobiales bacterium]